MYAHARIEHPESGEVYERGDTVPDDLPGLDELVEYGSLSDEEFTDPDPYGKIPTIDDSLLYLNEARNKLLSGEITEEEFLEQAKGKIVPVTSNDSGSAEEASQ